MRKNEYSCLAINLARGYFSSKSLGGREREDGTWGMGETQGRAWPL